MFKNRQRVVLNLLFFIAALLVFLAVSRHFQNYLNKHKVSDLLEEKITTELSEINSQFQGEAPGRSDLMSLAAEKPYRDFVVVNNDSLVFYTTNEIILSDTCIEEKEDGYTCFRETPNRYLVARYYKKSGDSAIIHLISLKNAYSLSNRFLVNRWIIDPDIPGEILIGKKEGDYRIEVPGAGPLYVSSSSPPSLSETQSRNLFFFFLLPYIALIILVFVLYEELKALENRSGLRWLLFAVDMVIVVFLVVGLRFPAIIFDIYLFDKSIFVFPSFIYGLGTAVLYVIPAFVLALAFYRWRTDMKFETGIVRFLMGVLLTAANTAMLFLGYMMVKYLIHNAEFTIKISQPVQLTSESVFGLGVLAFSLLASWVFSTTFMVYLKSLNLRKNTAILLWAAGAVFTLILSLVVNWLYAFLLLQHLVIGFFVFYPRVKLNIYFILVMLFVSALGYSIIIEKKHYNKEKDILELRAMQILNNRDKILELRISEMTTRIKNDSVFARLINRNSLRDEKHESQVQAFLQSRYFSSLKQNYEVNVTLCRQNTTLLVNYDDEPVNCFGYFGNIVSELGRETIAEGLYYIDDGDEVRNYLLEVKINNRQRIFVDIFEKDSPFTQGYPELLEVESEKRRWAAQYDYAIYWQDELISSFGDYSYPVMLNREILKDEPFYEHHLFDEGGKTLVITMESNPVTNALAGTSYLFLVFGVVFLVMYLLVVQRYSQAYLQRFRSRLQISIFSILLVTFIVIGYFTFNHIIHQNDEKNMTNLKELSHSILIELEHKFSQFDEINDVDEEYTYSQLVKFSKVFFSDINLYNTHGKLVASSRPQVFERNIISDRIHKSALNRLRNHNVRMFIMREKIGNYEFLSSYFPLRNYENDVIAYVNLPYFARQKRLTEEIADFLTTFINIYVVLTVLALFLIWITSNYITKPMETIKKSLRQTKLSAKNVKIDIQRKDEIGELVEEYNNMVDELERSAQKLAVTERETAWREMAKQVAHEIKNPLTPMKLSVQHIGRVLKTEDETSEAALKRFTQNMIDQIETLSEIASAFSDFAKMPSVKLKKVNIVKSAENAVALFDGLPSIRFRLTGVAEGYVKGDEKQLQRVFINLLKNAVQALEDKPDGLVQIHITRQADRLTVFVEDNGKGINKDEAEKIFLPNFTTKTSGTGLGLAMVRNIMKNMGGSIELKRTNESGSVFRLDFPEYNEAKERE